MREPFRGVEEPHPSIFGQERVREDQTTRIARARTAAWVRERTPNLRRMLATWRLTVCRLMTSSAAISLLLAPAPRRRSTFTSRAVSASPVCGTRSVVEACSSPTGPSGERAYSAASSNVILCPSANAVFHDASSSLERAAATYGSLSACSLG